MIRLHLIAAISLAVAGLSATATSAYAQAAPHKTPSQKDIAEARKHFQSAEAAKARGEYQTAAVEYLAAYELFEEPAFFYDTAEVYRLAGDEKGSLLYYTKYLELAPSGQGAPAARVAIDQLRRSIAAKEDAARRAADEDAKRKADEDARRKADDEARRAADEDARHKAAAQAKHTDDGSDDAAAPARHGGRTMRIAGLASAGVGVVSLGLGTAFGLKARSISNEASSWTTFDHARDQQGKADQRNMFIFSGIGAAAVVTGGVLYYLGLRADRATDSNAVSFVPSIGRSEITFTAAGHF